MKIVIVNDELYEVKDYETLKGASDTLAAADIVIDASTYRIVKDSTGQAVLEAIS